MEFALDAGSDRALSDIHERILVGPAIVFGVPMNRLLSSNEENNGGAAADGNTERSEEAPIIELTMRGGYLRTEIPRFTSDDTREVDVKNDVPDFEGETGWGLDMEVNIPVSEKAGYIILRSTLDMGFDPNPWSAQVGYTIPISTFFSAISGK